MTSIWVIIKENYKKRSESKKRKGIGRGKEARATAAVVTTAATTTTTPAAEAQAAAATTTKATGVVA